MARSFLTEIFMRDLIGVGIFGLTVLTLCAALPIGGAIAGGMMAAKAAGAAYAVGAAVLGGLGGLAVGILPVAVVNYIGNRKDAAYGTLEIMCLPSEIITEPFKTLGKLASVFKRSSDKKSSYPSSKGKRLELKPPKPTDA